MAKKGNSNLVPEARDALDKFKMEAAGEVGTRRAPPVYLSRRKNNEFRYAFGGTFFFVRLMPRRTMSVCFRLAVLCRTRREPNRPRRKITCIYCRDYFMPSS